MEKVLFKIFRGANILVKNSAMRVKDNCSEFLENHVLKDHFVSKEEFLDLKGTLLKVQEENKKIKNIISKMLDNKKSKIK